MQFIVSIVFFAWVIKSKRKSRTFPDLKKTKFESHGIAFN